MNKKVNLRKESLNDKSKDSLKANSFNNNSGDEDLVNQGIQSTEIGITSGGDENIINKSQEGKPAMAHSEFGELPAVT